MSYTEQILVATGEEGESGQAEVTYEVPVMPETKAIVNIERAGDVFTATRLDGTTFTF